MNAGEHTLGFVTIDGAVHLLPSDPTHALVFGRVGVGEVIGLDPADVGISNRAGSIRREGPLWILENLSRKRPLHVEEPAVVDWHLVPPGRVLSLHGPATVLVPGAVYTHTLVIEALVGESAGTPFVAAAATTPTKTIDYSSEDRLALVALFEGYLRRWPRHDPNPCSYEEAAGKVGWTSTSLRKRIEHLRERLSEEGLLDSSGTHGLRALAAHVFGTGVIGVADLGLLDVHSEGDRERS